MAGWIGVDLDGCLAEYHGWVNSFTIGKPVPLMIARVKRWIADGEDVRVFTARVDGGEAAHADGVDEATVQRYRDVEAIRTMIQDWCEEHIGVRLPVTNRKDYGMKTLYDDRCVQVEPNTGRLIGVEEC